MLLTALLFLAGFASLAGGAELLVRGSSRLAHGFGIPPLVVGLTVVAFGTSAPELAVSLKAAWLQQADVALGNVIGSNILNTLLILGLSSLAAPLVIAPRLLRQDLPIMIGVSFLVWLMALNGRVGRVEGGLLTAGMAMYLSWQVATALRGGMVTGAPNPEPAKRRPPAGPMKVLWLVLLAGTGLVFLVLGAQWLVTASVTVARALGLSDLTIGLTVVALGTSLPELATSFVATLKGERDIAVGNVVGSNLFNLLAVLGLTALMSRGGVPAAGQALQRDLPLLALSALACWPVFVNNMRIERWEGGLFLLIYCVYIGLLLAPAGAAGLRLYLWAALSALLCVALLAYPASRAARIALTRLG